LILSWEEPKRKDWDAGGNTGERLFGGDGDEDGEDDGDGDGWKLRWSSETLWERRLKSPPAEAKTKKYVGTYVRG
jgi:hypothetical protein